MIHWGCVGWVFLAKEGIFLRFLGGVQVIGCTYYRSNFSQIMFNSNPNPLEILAVVKNMGYGIRCNAMPLTYPGCRASLLLVLISG